MDLKTSIPDLRTVEGFREHVSEQRFKVLRQPIIDLKTNQLHHYEWLVRFDHDAHLEGIIRSSELSGVIRDLDISMLVQAILVLNAEPESPGIAINLSGASVDKVNYDSSRTNLS